MGTIKTKNERYFSAESKTTLQCRMLENGMARLSGYINVIGDVSKTLRAANGSKFRERIEKGAFKRDLEAAKKENRNILALLNHNHSRVLGNVQDGTLKLEEDDKGLRFDLETRAENVQGKEFTGCSFGFFDVCVNTERDRNSKMFYRSVNDLELDEVSLLERGYTPAYNQTSVHFERGTNDNPLLYFNLELEDCLKINDEPNRLNQKEENNMRDAELLKTRAKETKIEKTEMEETEKMERNVEENFGIKPIYKDYMIRAMDYDAAYRAQCDITDRINEYKSIARKRGLTTKENKELEALDGELEKINRKMDEESIFIKNDRICHERDKYEEEKIYKRRNARYSNNENGRYIDYALNNRSVPAAERRDFEALDALFRGGDPQKVLTRADNLIIDDNKVIVPTYFSKNIYSRLFAISPIFNFVEKYSGPGNLSIPVLDLTEFSKYTKSAKDFEEVEGESPAFKSVVLEGHLTSKLIPVGLSLVNNVNFNIVEYVFNLLAKCFRITHEKAILRGHSEGKIKGLTTLTNVVETAATDTITSDELVLIESSIYGEHLTENCCWVMHPRTYQKIKLLKDGVGRYSFEKDFSGLSKGLSTNILGHPVYISENMPEPTPGEVALYFGDFSEVMCKFSETVKLQVLKEVYATRHAIGILGFEEFDAKLKDNNSQGIVALKFKAE